MNQSTKSFAAGLMIIASVAAAVGIIIASSDGQAGAGPLRSYTVHFEPGSDVQGLDELSTVRLFGAEVGEVEDVGIAMTDSGPRVVVRFALPEVYELRRDAQITVQSQITGGARLNISSLGTGEALAAGDVLSGTTLTLGDVMAQLEALMPKASTGVESFTRTSDNINELVTDVRGEVDGIVAKYHKVMDTADQALANARDILGDTGTDIRETMANINQATAAVREKLPETFDNLNPALADARKLMAKADGSMVKLDAMLDDGKAITEDVRTIVSDNRPEIDQTFTNVRRASVELKGGIAEIRRAPWRLLNEPDPRDQRNLELFEAARQFADGAHDLQAAAMSIELAAADPATDPEHLDALRQRLAEQIDSFVELRQRLYDHFER